MVWFYQKIIFIILHFTSIHPFFCLSGAGSWGQQRSPDLPLPGHFLQLVRGNTEPFPIHPRDVISPVCPRSTPGSSPIRHVRMRFQIQADSLGYLPRWFVHLTRMPTTQMSKRLPPFDVEERLYSEPLLNNRIPWFNSQGNASHPLKKPHFPPLYQWSHSLYLYIVMICHYYISSLNICLYQVTNATQPSIEIHEQNLSLKMSKILRFSFLQLIWLSVSWTTLRIYLSV